MIFGMKWKYFWASERYCSLINIFTAVDTLKFENGCGEAFRNEHRREETVR